MTGTARTRCVRAIVRVALVATTGVSGHEYVLAAPLLDQPADGQEHATLAAAQRHFYNGRYEAAAALALELRALDPEDLTTLELGTSALLFMLKAKLGEPRDKAKAFKQCGGCPELMAAFVRDVGKGQALARARLQTTPGEETALFFLGKLDLNYVWLHLGLLGRRTGWNEYWEARRSLDTVLSRNPTHVRARVARAWIDYIVDTKMPRGVRWVLGGGDRKRALVAVKDAVTTDAEFFTNAEAAFTLWDLQVRERNVVAAVETARGLARDFPENRELATFLETHGTSAP